MLLLVQSSCTSWKEAEMLDLPHSYKSAQIRTGIDVQSIPIGANELAFYTRIRHEGSTKKWDLYYYLQDNTGSRDTIYRKEVSQLDSCKVQVLENSEFKIEVRAFPTGTREKAIRSWTYVQNSSSSLNRIQWNQNGKALWFPVVSGSEALSFKHETKPISSERIHCYKSIDEDHFPPPAFSTKETNEKEWQSCDCQDELQNSWSYRYELALDSIIHNFRIKKVGGDYPSVKEPEKLAEPLRYISTNTEFEKLMAAENLKEYIDDFWLQKCGSYERAREVIKAFYGRVERANLHFTEDREGWCTDRGMVYVVFGTPDRVMRDKNSERWIYLSQGRQGDLSFRFRRSGGRMILMRNSNYRKAWNENVYLWRNGIINRLND